jgi:hypothetical protein
LRPNHCRPPRPYPRARIEKSNRPHQAGSSRQQPTPFDESFANQAEVEAREITKATVNQARGPTGGAESKVSLLDERHPQASQDGVAGNGGAGYAPANDKQIPFFLAEPFETPVAGLG